MKNTIDFEMDLNINNLTEEFSPYDWYFIGNEEEQSVNEEYKEESQASPRMVFSCKNYHGCSNRTTRESFCPRCEKLELVLSRVTDRS